MKVYLRIDDFPYGAPVDKEKYKFSTAKKMLDIMNESGFSYMLGVVPELLLCSEAEYLDSLNNCTVCFHGFDHGMYAWRQPSEKGGEFIDMNESQILNRIKTNTWFMKRYNPYIFIPPFNAFTQELVNVLNLTDMKIITGGPETIEFGFDKFNFNSVQLKMADVYGTVREIIPQFDKIKNGDTICLHLSWEEPDTFETFIDICKDRELEVCSYEHN